MPAIPADALGAAPLDARSIAVAVAEEEDADGAGALRWPTCIFVTSQGDRFEANVLLWHSSPSKL